MNELLDQKAHSVHPVRHQPLPNEFPGANAIDSEEEEALLRVCRSRSLFRYYGPNPQHETDRFEREFCEYTGAGHVVAVTSGTAALHTALAALRVGPGQEVIVPAFLWISLVAAVLNLGAIPVLADIDSTFGIDVDDVRRKLSPRTTVVVAVHMCGAPANIAALAELAREHRVAVLEDCAQSLGATVGGKHVGTFGDIGIFSFQANKNISAGEGGAIVTQREDLYLRATALQDIGMAREPGGGAFTYEDLSTWNWARGYRMDELRAAVLRVQLRKLPRTLQQLRGSYARIAAALAGMQGLQLRAAVPGAESTGGFLLTLAASSEVARRLNARLRFHKIYCSAPATSNTILAEYGFHIYSNITALTRKLGTDARGTPWTLEANAQSVHQYGRGTCPAADALFARTQLLVLPAGLLRCDERDIVAAFAEATVSMQSV